MRLKKEKETYMYLKARLKKDEMKMMNISETTKNAQSSLQPFYFPCFHFHWSFFLLSMEHSHPGQQVIDIVMPTYITAPAEEERFALNDSFDLIFQLHPFSSFFVVLFFVVSCFLMAQILPFSSPNDCRSGVRRILQR